MEKEKKEIKINNHRQGMVHFVLLHSYLIFLIAVVLGVFFDSIFKIQIFTNSSYQKTGFVMMVISSGIIYWAQSSSSNFKDRKTKKAPQSMFEFGPYKYLRSPTHFGLFVLTLGFSLIINSLFSVIFTLIAYAITKLFFLKKEEQLLELKYGEIYSDYKKKVKNWV